MTATSAATPTPDFTLDVSSTPRTPFTRLVKVELRKMGDTRAGFWLLLAVALVTLAIVVIFFLASDEVDRTFINFMGATATPQSFVLPVLGILLVTSEWGQRTTLTTFALEPHRGRVIAAKVVAALLFGLAAIVVAVALAALATAVGGAPDAWANIGPDDFGKFALLQVSGILQGLAFGLIFLNSAAAIVLYFVLPTAFSIVASLWGALEDAAPWSDLGTASTPLFSGTDLSSDDWWHLASASMIWIVLPFVLGLVRVLRAEVK
jgi:ABC-2 type transport system permease protein